MVRSVMQIRQAWLKATKEKPIEVKDGEWDNFIEALYVDVKVGAGKVKGANITKPMSYISPMSGKEITCPSQRRQEMKEYGVREVDPSENREMLRDRGFDERNG